MRTQALASNPGITRRNERLSRGRLANAIHADSRSDEKGPPAPSLHRRPSEQTFLSGKECGAHSTTARPDAQEGWRAGRHAPSSRETRARSSSTKEAVAFLTRPCAPAVTACASSIELVAVANRTGVSRVEGAQEQAQLQPSPVGQVVVEYVEVELPGCRPPEGVGDAVGRRDLVLAEDMRDQLAHVRVGT